MKFSLTQASTSAAEVDYLILALFLASCLILALVYGLIFLYVFKYRAGSGIDRGVLSKKTWRLEIGWTIATLLIFFGLFVWGADLYVRLFQPPSNGLKIYVIGKQWMWKVQHEGGQREINALHIPIGRPIQLVMTSEDVIHDFSLPAFRIKHDVLPGRYETLWFTAVTPGTYHLFCTQFCGTGHAQMVGQVVVMSDPEFQQWLEQNGADNSMAKEGQILFMRYGCSGCHGGIGAGGSQSGSTVRAPALAGLYGSPVTLADGEIVTADEGYIRDCIMIPEKRRVASYPPVMPSFAGQISEGDLLKIIAYIKSLMPEGPAMSMTATKEDALSYLTDGVTLQSWLLTTDHKRIAILYFITITIFFFIGGAAAALMRYNLIVPEGMIGSAETYNRLFTMHGVVMVWFFLVPAVPVTLGNFLVPLMLGARDLAFPRLNLLSWYLFVLAGLVALYALFAGGVDTGWTFYTPLTSAYSNGHVIAIVVAIIVAGFSSIATGLNFIVTIHRLRAPGMGWFKMPVFLWTIYATSVILVLATPVLAMTLLLLAFERIFHIGVFDPAIGGDPLLFQHLFWFYSHPAVYVMILPGMGIVSEIVAAFSSKQLFGYKFVVWATIAIGVISFLVWGHHMFVAGTSLYSALVFSLLSFMVSVPSAIKVFNWIGTMHKGFIRFDAPMLYAIGFIGLFTMGGLTGLFVAALAADVHLTQTYFVVAHFHYVMVGGMVSAYFGGLHFWWPKITGRIYPEMWGRAAALIIFIGFNLTFFPQFILGYLGMPRRYHSYPPDFQVLNVLSSAGATILSVGYLLPLGYLIWSLFYGDRASANPWGATGLEWQTLSPPLTENFVTTPMVTEDPYNYPSPEAAQRHA